MQSSAFNSLLIQAVQDNEIKKVEDYLTLGASPHQMVDSKTHLMEIAVDKSENPRILQLLIDHNKNKPDNNISHRLIAKATAIQAPNALEILLPFTRLTAKETLPHIFDVIKEGNLSCLKIFINFKIDYLQMKYNNLSPLDYAHELGQHPCIEFIVNSALKQPSKITPSSTLDASLSQAVKNNDTQKIKNYLALGASSNQMIDQKTHLLEFVLDEKLPSLQCLIENSKNKPNLGICHRLIRKAIQIQNLDALKILLPFTQLTTKETLPYVFDMIKKGNPSCLKIFLDFKSDCLKMKYQHLFPMDYVAQLKRTACFQVIVNASLEDQYKKEFEKLKANTLSTIKSYKRWGDFHYSTSREISGYIKGFENCSITELEKLISTCSRLCSVFKVYFIFRDDESYEARFRKFIEKTIPKFNNLKNKIIALNKQKEQVPMIEEIQDDSKDHQTFFSISRIPSISQIQSINNPSLEPEISLSQRNYPSVHGI